MSGVDFVFDTPDKRLANPFHRIFASRLPGTKQLDIAVGYISEKSLRYLQELMLQYPTVNLNLTCGMHGSEGMTQKQLTEAKKLNETLVSSSRGGVYVTPRLPYHGKIYLFEAEKETSGYVGSTNLSSILPTYAETFEAGVYFPEAPSIIEEHLRRDIYPHWVPITDATLPIIADNSSPMYTVDDASPVATTDVVAIITSPAEYTIHVPLRAMPASSLNAHLGGGGARKQSSGGMLTRKWYEGELIVPQKYRQVPGYPQLGESFKVVTDDGWTFECKISGTGGKNLRSKGGLATFGTWMKSRLVEAGSLKFGETATEEHIRAYGRTYMTMRYHPQYDIWSFDLSVNENTLLEIPSDESPL